MQIKPRQEEILTILNQNGYATVKYLVDQLHYSSATINRDLNSLELQGYVKRTHGGVEAIKSHYVPISFRSHQMHSSKRRIAKLASEFVKDGDVIFIDASTTSQYMEQFLATKKDLTVITNNAILACNLANLGIKSICLGGEVVEPPSMLGGTDAVLNASRYKTNKMFFSTTAINDDGEIASGIYELLLKTIASQSEEVFYLVHENKFNQPFNVVYGDLKSVDVVISDFDFPQKTKERYKSTSFYTVKD